MIRSFFISLVGIVAMSFVPAITQAQAEPTKLLNNPFFSMDTAFREVTGTLETRLDLVRETGYAGMSRTWTNLDEAKQTVAAAEQRNLKFYALYMRCPVTSQGIELPSQFDEICAALAGHETVIWLFTDTRDYKPSSREADAIAVPAFQKAADRADKHGIKLALYPHKLYWVESFTDAIRVSELVDRANFGTSFNLCHSLAAGEEPLILDLLRKGRSKLFVVTINGADSGEAKAGWDKLIRPLGQGTYDPLPLLKVLKEIDYKGPIGYQGFGIRGDQPQIMRDTMAEWRRLISQ